MSRKPPAKATRDEPALWEFVPMSAYRRPDLPAGSVAANAWAAVRQILRQPDKDQQPARKEEELRALSEVRLEHVVRPIDWDAVSLSLDAALAALPAAAQGAPGVIFVIGQPHCGHADIVAAWAARHGASTIAAPSVEEILAGDGRWPASWPPADAAWALPQLEHCFLRHAQGLSGVRRLLESVAGGRAGHGVIGCDSWAWAYLQRVWPLPQPDALTLQAFDGERLSQLLARLAAPQRRRQLQFRNARTGQATLTVPQDGAPVSDEIVRLAAHCRGNFGIARSYWRRRLRAEPDPAAGTAPDADGDSLHDEIVWVSAALGELVLPVEAGEDVALTLHALLLHNGLPEAVLGDVLPLPKHRCVSFVLRLQHLGLVESHNGRWTVSALGYELVRQWLRGRGYLTDDF